ncbi:hypothetical protein XELAEV_18036643mg [Xenopus laevis]|uniref:Uncharacterized protein n=1 Tax=Xenopus laevis TaxID=8355 RepID=A0A974CAK2_XENLA|nr:hypothetical protein XELAEV_18036643mg [Xenopus laevis]
MYGQLYCLFPRVKHVRGKWDRDSIIAFQTNVAGVKLIAKAVGKTENGYRVDLLAKKVAVHDTVQEAGEAGDGHPPRQTITSRTENIPMDGSGDKSPQSTKTHPPKFQDHRQFLQAISASPKENEACVRSPSREDSSGKVNEPPLGMETKEFIVARRWSSIDLSLRDAVQALGLCVMSPYLFHTFPKENRGRASELGEMNGQEGNMLVVGGNGVSNPSE